MAVMADGSLNSGKRIALWILLVALSTFLIPLSASAQFTQPLQEPATQNGGNPFAPPVGDGANAPAEIGGDQATGAPPAVATGIAGPNPTTPFPQANGQNRTQIFLYRATNGPMGSRGTRMDMVIRPDQLSAQELGAIEGVLGVNAGGGAQTMDVTVTDAQLAQISNIMAPYPNTVDNGGRNQIVADSPNALYPKPGEENSYDFQGPLPTVRTFCRYLVILGAVCATIFMALAAWSMILGQPYGASRVVGTAGGFMLLLMGYTIWKIVQMETFNAMSNTPPVNQNRPTQALVAPNTPSTVPGIPNAAGGVPRTNMPVAPLLGVPGN